ncbi:MAG: FGGY family carbohydrate kinase [Bacteroidota bacterium]
MYLLGYELGNVNVRLALIKADTKEVVAHLHHPQQEMDIVSRQRGWAEQQPEIWWHHLCVATRQMLDDTGISPDLIQGIGIAYQMHGLVVIDKQLQVIRPAIIWSDSRSVPIGDQAFREMGKTYCLQHMLNSPGNFTASKFKWIKDNEPEVYERTHKILLPGDYIAMRLTGDLKTTVSGLTEGIFWDFKEKKVSDKLLNQLGLEGDFLPETVPTFSLQGKVSATAAIQTGLQEGTPLTYRAGDQPNNALSLNVLHPGEIAATSGSSGVVYGIVDKPIFDIQSRVNAFAHINYEENYDRIGLLLCLNGAGTEYSWIKHQVARHSHSYEDMERMASSIPIGSDGLCILPFGNGAERMFLNRNLNSHVFNLDFNRHSRAHMYRASLEGVAFSFVYGVDILKELGLDVNVIRVGNDNMFRSRIFSKTIATLLGCRIEVVNTNGAIGAARASGIAIGVYDSLEHALEDNPVTVVYEPDFNVGLCQQAYSYWKSRLSMVLESHSPSAATLEHGPEADYPLSKILLEKDRALTVSQLQLQAAQDLLEEAQFILEKNGPSSQKEVAELRSRISEQLGKERKWEAFEEHFDLLHNDFFQKVHEICPSLSMQELKMCAYLKMKLSTKEIASYMNLSTRGAETCRYRLRKKLGLKKGENFHAFLQELG